MKDPFDAHDIRSLDDRDNYPLQREQPLSGASDRLPPTPIEGRLAMANREQRGNREKRKPKAE
jgi:hypothetical protein